VAMRLLAGGKDGLKPSKAMRELVIVTLVGVGILIEGLGWSHVVGGGVEEDRMT
jgi:hypothetical protein